MSRLPSSKLSQQIESSGDGLNKINIFKMQSIKAAITITTMTRNGKDNAVAVRVWCTEKHFVIKFNRPSMMTSQKTIG